MNDPLNDPLSAPDVKEKPTGKPYHRPRLVEYGDVIELTGDQGNAGDDGMIGSRITI